MTGLPMTQNKRSNFPTLWRNFPVHRFMGGNLISFFGDQIYLIALPLLVLDITGSPLSMGMVSALERLPILMQPIIGVLADRFNRKRLLMGSDLGRCLIIGLLGLLFLTEQLEMEFIYAGAIIIGVLSQIYNTVQFASIPSLVSKHDLQAVNAIQAGFSKTAVLVGPGLGGFIISLYNPGYALLVNSLSFLVSFLAIASIPIGKTITGRKTHTSFFNDLREGFVFVWKTKPILFTNLAILTSMSGTTLFLTMLVFYLKEDAYLSAIQIGWLVSLGGVGAILGAISTNLWLKKFSHKQLLFVSSVLGGLSIILFSQAQSFIWLVLFNTLGDFMASIMNPCIVTIRQTLTPDHLLGRVQATSRFMSWILLPLFSLLAGVLAMYIGSSTTIFIGGLLATIASLFYLHPSLKKEGYIREEL
ncbi:MFS transporter [Lentibacillus sp. N15]|uniref:MFS transporter n=1 Tax=Lentibacillus songyuanensis TaxID=3136161 RepID=UPI0031BBC4D1